MHKRKLDKKLASVSWFKKNRFIFGADLRENEQNGRYYRPYRKWKTYAIRVLYCCDMSE